MLTVHWRASIPHCGVPWAMELDLQLRISCVTLVSPSPGKTESSRPNCSEATMFLPQWDMAAMGDRLPGAKREFGDSLALVMSASIGR